ncbi:ATP-binding protein [Variovorax sp. RCC_210]|uniref:ATP-binding protein n=1 Tax=Variovorax sp. RCC_210 TaxID=3239217 RepID=UPI003524DBE9
MKALLAIPALVLSLLLAGAAAAAHLPADKDLLTGEEQQWVARHPALRVGFVANIQPIEYFENGEPHGLSVEYLRAMAAKAGIRLSPVPCPDRVACRQMLVRGDIDVVSDNRPLGAPSPDVAIAYTARHQVSTGLVVTQADRSLLLDAVQLNGMSIAIGRQSPYEAVLRKQLPKSTFVVTDSARQLLASVRDGAADVGIATEAFVLPYLDREFKAYLQIAGVVPYISLQLDFGVRADDPVALSVLDKLLKTLTLEERRDIYGRWLGQADFDMPFVTVVARHYVRESLLALLALLLLVALAYQTRRRRQAARRNEREKTHFLSLTNHEMRSPMNAMLGAVELLRLTPMDKGQQHLADLADQGGQALLRVLDEGLDPTGANAVPPGLTRTPTDAAALVRSVAELHRLRAKEKNIALTVTLHTPTAWLMLDEARVAQVLRNLVSNAIKFTEAGGVDIAVRVDDADAPAFRRLTIDVTDTGVGISGQTQARLFQPYAQAADSYGRAGGTGLGLFISRELATLMGGTLSMTSMPGQGTTVTLALMAELAVENSQQAAQEEAPDPHVFAHGEQAPARPFSVASSGVRVLVVEDTPANQEVLRAQLLSLGCEPVVAPDAARAMALFAEENFQLVLMDVDLPDKDGYTLGAELRRFEAGQQRGRVPIIAISASTGEEHLQRCTLAGMDNVLSKPIRLARLKAAIEHWCGVKLVPHGGAAAPQDPSHASDEAGDVDVAIDALLQATALHERDAGLHAARRLHEAAAQHGSAQTAQAAALIESSMRAPHPWPTDEQAQMLARMVDAWESDRG